MKTDDAQSERLMSIDALRGWDMAFISGLGGLVAALGVAIPGCRSHQYEIAAGWYKPMAYKVVDEILRRVDAGDTTPMPKEFLEQLHKKMCIMNKRLNVTKKLRF